MTPKTYAMKSTALAQDDPISLLFCRRKRAKHHPAGRDLCSIRDLTAGRGEADSGHRPRREGAAGTLPASTGTPSSWSCSLRRIRCARG